MRNLLIMSAFLLVAYLGRSCLVDEPTEQATPSPATPVAIGPHPPPTYGPDQTAMVERVLAYAVS